MGSGKEEITPDRSSFLFSFCIHSGFISDTLYNITRKHDTESGRSMRTRYLSLIAISAYCFYAILLPVLYPVLAFPANITGLEQLYFLTDPSFWAFISLCGGIAFLLATKNENSSWYLGIPLCIMFAITAVSPLVSAILVIHDPSPPIYHPGVLWILLSQAAVCLIPPCAALFFWSQRALGRWVPVLAALALLITISSAAMLYAEFSPWLVSAGLIPQEPPTMVDGQLVRMENDGALILYLLFGLPIIGILFLVLAGMSWLAARRGFPASSPIPEAP
jgi:hypothetical protein